MISAAVHEIVRHTRQIGQGSATMTFSATVHAAGRHDVRNGSRTNEAALRRRRIKMCIAGSCRRA
jgi:hypothetical protein